MISIIKNNCFRVIYPENKLKANCESEYKTLLIAFVVGYFAWDLFHCVLSRSFSHWVAAVGAINLAVKLEQKKLSTYYIYLSVCKCVKIGEGNNRKIYAHRTQDLNLYTIFSLTREELSSFWISLEWNEKKLCSVVAARRNSEQSNNQSAIKG